MTNETFNVATMTNETFNVVISRFAGESSDYFNVHSGNGRITIVGIPDHTHRLIIQFNKLSTNSEYYPCRAVAVVVGDNDVYRKTLSVCIRKYTIDKGDIVITIKSLNGRVIFNRMLKPTMIESSNNSGDIDDQFVNYKLKPNIGTIEGIALSSVMRRLCRG